MATIDQIKSHCERQEAECRAFAQANAEEALAEMRKVTPDPGVIEDCLARALVRIGEARAWGNAVHDIENGEVG